MVKVKEKCVKIAVGSFEGIEYTRHSNEPDIVKLGEYETVGWGYLDYFKVILPSKERDDVEVYAEESERDKHYFVYNIPKEEVYHVYVFVGDAETPSKARIAKLKCPNVDVEGECSWCFETCEPTRNECEECKCYFCNNSKHKLFDISKI